MQPVITMTEQQIIDEINAIGDLTKQRMEELYEKAPSMAMLYSHHQMLEEAEAARMHELKIALTVQYGHLHTPQAAHERIMERIRQRKAKGAL